MARDIRITPPPSSFSDYADEDAWNELVARNYSHRYKFSSEQLLSSHSIASCIQHTEKLFESLPQSQHGVNPATLVFNVNYTRNCFPRCTYVEISHDVAAGTVDIFIRGSNLHDKYFGEVLCKGSSVVSELRIAHCYRVRMHIRGKLAGSAEDSKRLEETCIDVLPVWKPIPLRDVTPKGQQGSVWDNAILAEILQVVYLEGFVLDDMLPLTNQLNRLQSLLARGAEEDVITVEELRCDCTAALPRMHRIASHYEHQCCEMLQLLQEKAAAEDKKAQDRRTAAEQMRRWAMMAVLVPKVGTAIAESTSLLSWGGFGVLAAGAAVGAYFFAPAIHRVIYGGAPASSSDRLVPGTTYRFTLCEMLKVLKNLEAASACHLSLFTIEAALVKAFSANAELRAHSSAQALTTVHELRKSVRHLKVVSVVGPEGSGKTTFLDVAFGVWKPPAGYGEFKFVNVSGVHRHPANPNVLFAEDNSRLRGLLDKLPLSCQLFIVDIYCWYEVIDQVTEARAREIPVLVCVNKADFLTLDSSDSSELVDHYRFIVNQYSIALGCDKDEVSEFVWMTQLNCAPSDIKQSNAKSIDDVKRVVARSCYPEEQQRDLYDQLLLPWQSTKNVSNQPSVVAVTVFTVMTFSVGDTKIGILCAGSDDASLVRVKDIFSQHCLPGYLHSVSVSTVADIHGTFEGVDFVGVVIYKEGELSAVAKHMTAHLPLNVLLLDDALEFKAAQSLNKAVYTMSNADHISRLMVAAIVADFAADGVREFYLATPHLSSSPVFVVTRMDASKRRQHGGTRWLKDMKRNAFPALTVSHTRGYQLNTIPCSRLLEDRTIMQTIVTCAEELFAMFPSLSGIFPCVHDGMWHIMYIVPLKGFIPVGEKELPRQVCGFPTYVQTGCCHDVACSVAFCATAEDTVYGVVRPANASLNVVANSRDGSSKQRATEMEFSLFEGSLRSVPGWQMDYVGTFDCACGSAFKAVIVVTKEPHTVSNAARWRCMLVENEQPPLLFFSPWEGRKDGSNEAQSRHLLTPHVSEANRALASTFRESAYYQELFNVHSKLIAVDAVENGVRKLFITLAVPVKRFIPIGEPRILQTRKSHYRTKVVTGWLRVCANPGFGLLTKPSLSPGLAIAGAALSGYNYATLSCFLQFRGKTFGVTSAHTFYDENDNPLELQHSVVHSSLEALFTHYTTVNQEEYERFRGRGYDKIEAFHEACNDISYASLGNECRNIGTLVAMDHVHDIALVMLTAEEAVRVQATPPVDVRYSYSYATWRNGIMVKEIRNLTAPLLMFYLNDDGTYDEALPILTSSDFVGVEGTPINEESEFHAHGVGATSARDIEIKVNPFQNNFLRTRHEIRHVVGEATNGCVFSPGDSGAMFWTANLNTMKKVESLQRDAYPKYLVGMGRYQYFNNFNVNTGTTLMMPMDLMLNSISDMLVQLNLPLAPPTPPLHTSSPSDIADTTTSEESDSPVKRTWDVSGATETISKKQKNGK